MPDPSLPLARLLLVVGLTYPLALVEPAGAAQPPGPLDVEPGDLRPGLLAHYASDADPAASLDRVDVKPAFTLGQSSPHPRLPSGPFEVTWTGVLYWKETAPVTFDAFLGGELAVEVDGTTVLSGRGTAAAEHVTGRTALTREPGLYRLKVRFRALARVPARLQIGWSSPAFAREPLPAWQLKHLASDLTPAARQEEIAGRGKAAVIRLGCAQCHRGAFPGVVEPPPGPALSDLRGRVSRDWLLHWLDDPARVHPDARMPALFTPDRAGFAERWLVTEALLGPHAERRSGAPAAGDHRAGRLDFVGIGCTACHQIPDMRRDEQQDLDRVPLRGLGDRFPAETLAAFLANPRSRYPDGRMPHLPLPPRTARDIAAYLLLWSSPTENLTAPEPPTRAGLDATLRRLKVNDRAEAAAAILREKRCAACHPGLEAMPGADVPLANTGENRGCLSGRSLPRFGVDDATRRDVMAYLGVAAREKHASPFAARQRELERAGCARCHQRDSDRPPPLEAISSTLGGSRLQSLPFQRTPRLTNALQKYHRAHLVAAVREGVTGLKDARYSFRMPTYGDAAVGLVRALAEGDGELPDAADGPDREPADPTVGPLVGPELVGFQGYACVSCHVWNGQTLAQSDPGAVGPDLTKVRGRIRRDWFDRFLEDPARSHPGTPMPAIFPRGRPATLPTVLDGDPARQKEALWSYFALGKEAPSPKPPPAVPIPAPARGEDALVAQIPLRLPEGGTVESICILTETHDLVVYDVGAGALRGCYTGAQLLRGVHGRLRTFSATGTRVAQLITPTPSLRLVGLGGAEVPAELMLLGYDRLADGAVIRTRARFTAGAVEVMETLRVARSASKRELTYERQFAGIPPGRVVETRVAEKDAAISLTPDRAGHARTSTRFLLPASPPVVPAVQTALADPVRPEGSLERPGYRAIAYPRPKLPSGEDLVVPVALAVHPRDGRVFVASLKRGELFVLRDPGGDGKAARFEDYARGLFQEAFSLLAEDDAVYVLHRRNLTRVVDRDGDGRADRFDRVAALPHGVADTYDYGYGLVRDRSGAFVISYAPYANRHLPGSGGAIRLVPGREPEEVAFGFRNPVGWCTGPDGEVFFTDNQGEWVATNKLCHLVAGRFYGFPNPAQKQHTTRPPGKAAVWVPYDWARSINGVTYDGTGRKFGPFAGQFFLAELMFGGAIVRANLERVNGEYQGACFPFWGKGLLGPVSLAFDPKGRLFVGGITEPGWMAQPDRGALFRLNFTGQTPFELQSIHARPRGFRIVLTTPVRPETARDPASYHVESYRYEYTGAYGSPELDRVRVPVVKVEVAPDGRSAELTTAPLVRDRVYLISARGVRSAKGEAPVHPTGAYTLNEIPTE